MGDALDGQPLESLNICMYNNYMFMDIYSINMYSIYSIYIYLFICLLYYYDIFILY